MAPDAGRGPDAGWADGGAGEPDAGGDGDAGVAGGADAGAATPGLHFWVQPRPHDPASPEVEVARARYGDPLRVEVTGLAPGDSYDVITALNGLLSSARFVADEDGTVDLRDDAPVQGDWDEASGEAFIATARGNLGPTFDLTVRVTVQDLAGDVVVSGDQARASIDEGIVIEDVDQGVVKGTMTLPPGDGPFPAVLCFGGSEGGRSGGEWSAYYLATLGYAALGVAYFGEPGLPANLVDVPLENLEAGLAHLAADPRIDPDRIAVMGGSRGGELALLLGAHFPQVRAVVADVPSGYVIGGLVPGTAAWTYQGMPFVEFPFPDDAMLTVFYDDDGLAHYAGTPAYLEVLDTADPAALEAATIDIENVNGPVLIRAGEDDQLWPSCVLGEAAWDRLVETDHVSAYDDVYACYPAAGHFLSTPGWPTVGHDALWRPDWNAYMEMGGTVLGNAHADRAGDTALRGFLEAALAP